MPFQMWNEGVVSDKVAGPNLTASVTATSILNAVDKYPMPQGFWYVGRKLRVTATGQLGNIATTPGTLTLDIRMGPTSNIIVWNGGAMQLSSTAHTALPFWLEVLLTCRAVGSGTSSNLMGQGRISAQAVVATAVADNTATHHTLLLPNTSPAVGTGFDYGVAMIMDLFATFSLNNANAIQVQQFLVEDVGRPGL
jgi:hypothetical protein